MSLSNVAHKEALENNHKRSGVPELMELLWSTNFHR
eukprot:UN20750